MLYLFIYLASIIDKISFLLLNVSVILAAVGTVLFLIVAFPRYEDLFEEDNTLTEPQFKEKRKRMGNFIKKFYVVLLVCFIIGHFIPSKTAIYQMAGVYCGKQINQSVQIDKKLQKVINIIDLQLDKSIKELQGNK
jgi:hypothetical protein